MNISYIASSGNIYNLTTRVMTRTASYHAWEFEPQATELRYGERVSAFTKKASTYQTTLLVRGGKIQRMAVLTALHDDFENDVRHMTPGRIIYGDWYCDCYIIASQTTPDKDYSTWTENTITIYVPSGFWVREETRHFSAPVPEASEYLEYSFDYEYDYTPPAAAQTVWETDSPFESDFEMRIYGACVNPRVVVNGYPYLVNASIAEGETLVINSQNHTVMCGNTNLFDNRNKVQSVFEKIPSGSLALTWGGFAFDLILYEERSEPKW